MGDLNDVALDEARSSSETLGIRELIEILEMHHVDGERGVTRGTIDEYAAALDYDPEVADEALDERVSDSHEWEPGADVYRLDGDRFSIYPPRWHEELGETTDLTKHVALINSSVEAAEGGQSRSVTGAGAPKRKVVRAAQVLSGMEREAARGALEDLRKKGKLEAPADQHRDASFRLPDRD